MKRAAGIGRRRPAHVVPTRTLAGALAALALAARADAGRELHSLTLRALANEVVVGLLAATLARP